MIARVTAATRLHFGLVRVPGPGEPAGRSFGGLGLMIDVPTVTVTAEPAAAWTISGSLADRARSFCERLNPKTPFVLTADGPPEHVGLGVGTALGLAVAAAITTCAGRRMSPEELAERSGRGERSGVGVHGFGHGGLVVDRGKAPRAVTSDCQSIPFPADWCVVLVRPTMPATWHGATERAAFARPRPDPGPGERLERIRDDSIIPAVGRGDFGSFTASLYEYNRLAGEPFAADQGGSYAGPAVAGLVETLRAWGVKGVGQSSWGPTVFAFVECESDARGLVRRIQSDGMVVADTTVASAAGPATVEIN